MKELKGQLVDTAIGYVLVPNEQDVELKVGERISFNGSPYIIKGIRPASDSSCADKGILLHISLDTDFVSSPEVEYYINQIQGEHSPEEWLALQDEIEIWFNNCSSVEQKQFADSGYGEMLCMICSAYKDDDLLFEYKTTPNMGYVGMPGGYSIGVTVKGEVVKKEFICGDENPKTKTVLGTIPELTETISAIIMRHSSELEAIPNELNNGTLDGSHDCFKFGDKRISSWTIQRTDPAKIQKDNPLYYEEYKDNIFYENTVLDIFDEIADEINKYNIGIHL